MSNKRYVKFINNVVILHDCSKIKIFHLHLDLLKLKRDPQIATKLGFATSKNVEDLDLKVTMDGFYLLPQFLFNNASLVRLKMDGCSLVPDGNISWGFLTLLIIRDCNLTEQTLARILSGCPLLKSLELTSSSVFDRIVIASQSLKRLVLSGFTASEIEISCPKLEELSLKHTHTKDPKLFAQAIESVLSCSLLLESLSIRSIHLYTRGNYKLVIASKSLKRLVVGDISSISYFEISCPKLEILKFVELLNIYAAKLLNLPSSSLCAIIDFYQCKVHPDCRKWLIENILHQLQHVKEIKIGSWLIEIISTIQVGGGFSRPLNIKCLTVDSPYVKKQHSGIAHLLRISPVLEKLVITVPRLKHKAHTLGKDYWISNATVFDCLISHLKILKIVVFGYAEEDTRRQHMLNLVHFLLNNARVLEKMVVIVEDDGTGFLLEVSQELVSLPRCSQDAIVEVLYSKEIEKFL